MLYENGYEVEQNYFIAAKLFKKACDGESAKGCVYLGIFYEYGLGVKQNYAIAKELFGKACDLGLQLGYYYYSTLSKIY